MTECTSGTKIAAGFPAVVVLVFLLFISPQQHMSDKADVEHPLTPTREDQATSDESFSVISESAVADKPADSDESEWKNVSSDHSDDDQAKRTTSHPLQPGSAIDVSAYSNDTWAQQQQESSLLDAEGLPNAQDGDSGATTPVKEREIELDSDTSHIKVNMPWLHLSMS